MITRRKWVCGALLAAPASAILAQAPASADDLRPELNALLPQHRLMGKTRLTVWGFQVYDASFWAAPGFQPDSYARHGFALELAYLRDFASKDIAERSLSEMRRSSDISESQGKIWASELQRLIPDVKKGDRVMGINRPGTSALLLVNSKMAGEIQDADFARLFFGIWLSPKTSEPKMRSALLAGVN